MATKKLKARVEIDGEKEYKQAISELNQGNRVLSSEMKLLQEQYKGSEGSMEALRAKSGVLERQLLQQKDKVQTLREALKNAATQSGEASQQTQNWQIQLNNAEREQVKLERALEETNKALDNQGQEVREDANEMTGLGDTVDQVANKLGIHIPEGARNALNGMEGFSVGTVAAMTAAAGGVAAVIKTVKELHDLTVESAKWADDLITRAAQTGLDASTLQGLDFAQQFVDFENLDQTLVKVTASMEKAREGAEAQSAAFKQLGVSVTNTDGTLRSNWETFLDTIDALGKVQNATERDVIANDLFGKSYASMKPLIDAGTKALRSYMEQAQDTGIVLTESQIKVLGEVDDEHNKLIATVEAEKRKFSAEYAPAVKAAMETASKAVKMFGDMLIETGLIENTAALVTNVLGIVDAGMNMVDAMPSWMNPIETVSGALKGLAVIAATVADSMSLVGSLLKLDFHGAATALGWNLHQGEMSHLQQLKYSDPKYVSYNAAGDWNWRGGLTWLGEHGPELVELPQGSRIYSNQESRQIAAAAAPTDTRRLEQQQAETNALLREVRSELAGWRIKGRMARA